MCALCLVAVSVVDAHFPSPPLGFPLMCWCIFSVVRCCSVSLHLRSLSAVPMLPIARQLHNSETLQVNNNEPSSITSSLNQSARACAILGAHVGLQPDMFRVGF